MLQFDPLRWMKAEHNPAARTTQPHLPTTTPQHHKTMRHFSTAFALAIAITGVAQSTQAPAQGNAPAAKPWLNPALTYGSVTDIDGNTYATIEIGRQVWMAENLRTTRYRNGDTIPTDRDVVWNEAEIRLTGAWCHYRNSPEYEMPYGKLYNWYALADRRGICPQGWHVPINAEWNTLINHLGGEDVAGGKLKSKTLWEVSKEGGTNTSGFSGLPGGSRSDAIGDYYSLGYIGFWWSASEVGANDDAWYRYLDNQGAGVGEDGDTKMRGFCLRCVRD
jgi:uncharacterized protein (TIGR02145 family)